jgi:hypothetical protein
MFSLFEKIAGLRKKIAGSRTRKPGLGSRNRFRPQMELLEARDVPTVSINPVFGNFTRDPGHTGPASANTPIKLIFEGSYWDNPTGITRDDVKAIVNNLIGSNYMDSLAQYGTTGHAFLAATINDTSLKHIGVSDSPFYTEDEIKGLVDSKLTDVDFAGPDTQRPIFIVVTAPGVSDLVPDGSGGTTTFNGGYHHSLTHSVDPDATNASGNLGFAWGFLPAGDRATEIDSYSQMISHELVEARTDPFINQNSANMFKAGINWSTDVDEIADFEPESARYLYRLGNGTVVQAYWSDADQHFVVPDGNSQVFSLNPQWVIDPVTKMGPNSTFLWNFDLLVNGDQKADLRDVITVEVITTGVQTGGLRVTMNGETVSFDANKIQNLTIDGKGGDDVINIESLPANVHLTIVSTQGADKINFAPTAGRMNDVLGPVDIVGNGNTDVAVNDQGTADYSFIVRNSVNYYISGDQLLRNDTVHVRNPISGVDTQSTFVSGLSFSGIHHLDVTGGHCQNTFAVDTSSLTVPLAVHGNGSDSLVFDDHLRAPDLNLTYTLEASRITRVALDTDATGKLAIFQTATVDYTSMQQVALTGGNSSAVYNILGIGSDTPLNVFSGGASNTFNIGNDTTTLDAIHGDLHLFGSGTNSVNLNDRFVQPKSGVTDQVSFDISGTSDGAAVIRTHSQTSTVLNVPVTKTTKQTITFSGIQNVSILGGGTGNRFNVLSSPTNATLSIDGGAGLNTLDYSAFGQGANINLAVGTATGLGRIQNITNVIGSAFDDLIVGDARANGLRGGDGRDVIIGGQGADLIEAGNGEDLLLAGSTAFDNRPDILNQIWSEWTRTDLAYADRVQLLFQGGGLNGETFLAGYLADLGGNRLLGGAPDLDLFLGSLSTDVNDRVAGETFVDPAKWKTQSITFNPLADQTYGAAPIVLNATSSSGLPVTYRVTSGPATITGNVLTITGGGMVTVKAFQGGSDVFAPAAPVQQSFTVNKAHLTITADNQTRVFGQADAFTASFTGFVNNDTVGTSDIQGQVAFTSTDQVGSPVGTYVITPSLGTLASNDYDFQFVTGTLTVTKANSVVAVVSDNAFPGVGQAITFTATVTAEAPGSGVPTGTVTFRDGPTPIGTATLTNGKASLQVSNLSLGTHLITVSYAGDSNFNTKTSAVLNQKVLPATAVSLQSSLAASTFGQAVSFTATVAPVTGTGTPTGTVTFKDGTATLGTATLNGGKAVFTTPLLSAGTHTITAVYGGSSSFGTSTSAGLVQTVNKATTSLVLTSSLATVPVLGQGAVLTAKLNVASPGAGIPTGTITFMMGTTVIGTGKLVNGVAVFKLPKLAKGKHIFTAIYSGDANFVGSTSAGVVVTYL